MRKEVAEHMVQLLKTYTFSDPFNTLLQEMIADKAQERSVWADVTLQTHFTLNGNCEEITHIATITEMMLLALDIVDDLQDQDNFSKRWMACPQDQALNALLAFLIQASAEIGRLHEQYGHSAIPVNSMIVSLMRSVNGQFKDISAPITTEAQYMEMIQEKSGALLRFCMQMGTLGTSPTEQTMEQLQQLADYVGIISQMDNDLRDLLRFDFKNDLVQKKRTLPIQFLLTDDAPPISVIHDYYEGRIDKDEFLNHKLACVQYIEDSGAIEYTRVIQRLFQNRAEQLLEQLDADPVQKEKLKTILFRNR